MFQNGLPGILLLIHSNSLMQVYMPPNHSIWFFQHGSKTMPSKAGSFVSESKYHLFHIPRFSATVFFSYLSNSMFVSMCVFQLSRTKKLPEVPDKPRIDVKRCFFSEICCCWDRCCTKLKQPPRTLMLQCLKKNMGVDWLANDLQPKSCSGCSEAKQNTNKPVSFCHLTCSGCQAFSNGVDCLDVVRDSCSCRFWGVTMGKSQILFTAIDLGQECNAWILKGVGVGRLRVCHLITTNVQRQYQ